MLTDLFLKKQGSVIPAPQLAKVLSEVCVPLAGRRIIRLQIRDPSLETTDQLMVEFEMCLSLVFKPLRHHLQQLVAEDSNLPILWATVLQVVEKLLAPSPSETQQPSIPANLKSTMNSLTNEHLKNAIQVLLNAGVLSTEPRQPGDLTDLTWQSVHRMGVDDVTAYKLSPAANPSTSGAPAEAASPPLAPTAESAPPPPEA